MFTPPTKKYHNRRQIMNQFKMRRSLHAYLGMTMTNRSCIHEEIKIQLRESLLPLGQSFAFPFAASFYADYVHSPVIVPIVSHGYESWPGRDITVKKHLIIIHLVYLDGNKFTEFLRLAA